MKININSHSVSTTSFKKEENTQDYVHINIKYKTKREQKAKCINTYTAQSGCLDSNIR